VPPRGSHLCHNEARENVIDALRRMLSPEPRAADDWREREPLHLTIAA
jgi:2'-5' RNA ligase